MLRVARLIVETSLRQVAWVFACISDAGAWVAEEAEDAAIDLQTYADRFDHDQIELDKRMRAIIERERNRRENS